MVPRHWKAPFTMMASRVHRASHSSMLGLGDSTSGLGGQQLRDPCSTPAPGNLLPVGGEDHSSPFSDDAHDGIPQHAASLGVHARGGLVLGGAGAERAGAALGASLSWVWQPPWLTPWGSSARWQMMHKSHSPVGKTGGRRRAGRAGGESGG